MSLLSKPVVPGANGAFIQSGLAGWMKYASADSIAPLQQNHQLLQLPDAPWFTQAAEHERQALLDYQSRSRRSSYALASSLACFKGIVEFAEPLLKARLHADLNQAPDLYDNHFIEILRVPTRLGLTLKPVPKAQSLLQAALQNFTRDARFEAGSALAPANALILDMVAAERAGAQPIFRYHYTRKLPIDALVFARLCHALDLGGQYQQHLADVFEDDSTQAQVRSQSISAYKDLLRVRAQQAFLQAELSADARQMLLDLLDGKPARLGGKPVVAGQFELFGEQLFDAWYISTEHRANQPAALIVYLPGAPSSALKEYPSRQAFYQELRANLRLPGYQALVQGYALRVRQPFLRRRFEADMFHMRENKVGGMDRQYNPDATLYLNDVPVREDLFAHLCKRHLLKIKADAKLLAVPSAEADEQARQARLAHWESVGFNALNAAAFFVPGLGEVMAVVMVGQMIKELVDGVQAWQIGDFDEAWGHFSAVGLNVAMATGMGLAGAALPALEASELINGLRQVRLPNGEQRLWRPTLEPYVAEVDLSGHVPDTAGLYELQQKTYIRIDGRAHEVFKEADGGWRIRHSDTAAYQPELLHNGQGAWRMRGEEPLLWSHQQLLRRIGHACDGLSDEQLEQAARISATSDDVLRQVHLDQAPLPALLADTLNRLQVGQRQDPFIVVLSPQARLIQRDFPSLPDCVVQELADATPIGERDLMLAVDARVPLTVAEEARLYVRQVRISRALECLAGVAPMSADGERTALGLLPTLPGWTGEVRLELREAHLEGPVLQHIGEPQALHKTLVKVGDHYDIHDEQGQSLAVGQALFDAVLKALPDAERNALGVQIYEGQVLMRRLYNVALIDRARVGQLLGLESVRPWVRSPLRLVEGRVGYPLSGRGRNALDTLRRETEWKVLEGGLGDWVRDAPEAYREHRSVARARIEAAWRAGVESGEQPLPTAEEIDLSGLQIGELPVLTAQFSRVTVLGLAGMGISTIPETFIQGFANLRALALERNQFTAVPSLANLKKLEVLNLNHNQIASSPTMFDPLMLLPRLETLGVQANQLTLTHEALQRLASLQLKHLSLINNQIVLDAVMADGFSTFVDLEVLLLDDNPLQLAPQLGTMTRLQRLELSNTQLNAWPDGLTSLMSAQPCVLQTVDLGANQIIDVPDLSATTFGAQLGSQSHEAQWLHLSFNPLSEESVAQLTRIGVRFMREQPTLGEEALLAMATNEQVRLWELLLRDPATRNLRLLMEKVQNIPEFEHHRLAVGRRVWSMLEHAAQHADFRQELIEIADNHPDSCEDATVIGLSEMEVADSVLTEGLATALQPNQRNLRLIMLFKRLFRREQVQSIGMDIAFKRGLRWKALFDETPAPALSPLDDISDTDLRNSLVDDVEICLVLRKGLAEELGYEEPAGNMLYREAARVSDATALNVAAQVRANDIAARRHEWMLSKVSWRNYLKQRHAAELSAESHQWDDAMDYLYECSRPVPSFDSVLTPKVASEIQALTGKSVLDADGKLQKIELDSPLSMAEVSNMLSVAREHSGHELLLRLTERETHNIPDLNR